MPLSPASSSGGSTANPSRDDLVSTGVGMISQAWDLGLQIGNLAPGSQVLRATGIGLISGDIITNVIMCVGVAAAGTAPTLQKMGILDKNGNVLAKTADLSASAIWTSIQLAVGALTSPLTISTSDMYYAVYLRNGNYGTTNPTFLSSPGPGFTIGGLASKPLRFGTVAAQTDITGPYTLVAGQSAVWFGVS